MKTETVLVTGASSGIGRELARCFAREGSSLVLVARNRAALDSLADELRRAYGGRPRVIIADLSKPQTPSQLLDALEASNRPLDVLVNNAGFGAHGRFAELSLERQLEMVQVNVAALTHLARLFLPGMIQRRKGGLLNVASTAAFQPGPNMAVYYASKAFVLSLTEAIAEEVVGTGVTVTALCPGATATSFAERAQFRGSRLLTRGAMSAAAVADYGYRAFRRGQVVAIPGFRNRALAASVRLGPRSVVRKAVKAFNALGPSPAATSSGDKPG